MSQIIDKYYDKINTDNYIVKISVILPWWSIQNFNHFGIYLLILIQFSPAFKLS